ncbi:MAG: hypothetical protein ACQEQC_08750 [Elusimicrobiota bacterium]
MNERNIIDLKQYVKSGDSIAELVKPETKEEEYYGKIASFGSSLEPQKKNHVPLQYIKNFMFKI